MCYYSLFYRFRCFPIKNVKVFQLHLQLVRPTSSSTQLTQLPWCPAPAPQCHSAVLSPGHGDLTRKKTGNLINEDRGFDYSQTVDFGLINQQRWRIQLISSVKIEDSTVTIAGWAIEKDRTNHMKRLWQSAPPPCLLGTSQSVSWPSQLQAV